jgi:hypothetical protein
MHPRKFKGESQGLTYPSSLMSSSVYSSRLTCGTCPTKLALHTCQSAPHKFLFSHLPVCKQLQSGSAALHKAAGIKCNPEELLCSAVVPPICTNLGRMNLTSLLWEEGVRSSYFLPVKMSTPTKWHFAWPCFPVFEVETSTTCSNSGHKSRVLRAMWSSISAPLLLGVSDKGDHTSPYFGDQAPGIGMLTLQGLFLMTMKPFLRIVPAC